jgi:signal transduction histidine kinase/CheY-like chemotaxis protein
MDGDDALVSSNAAPAAGEHPPSAPDELRTVSVPEPFREIFLRAQHYVAQYFSDRVDDASHGSITIAGERYILVRAASMSVEFFELVSSLYRDKGTDAAHSVAKNLLFDVAHAIGKADAKVFHTRMGVTDPVERLSAGPVHFAYAGWANVLIHPESRPDPSEEYYLLYDHPYSFEADAWLKRGVRVDFPVCVMNSGYSSGWCEDSFGLPLVAAEVECRAMGDEQCRFVMAPPSRIEGHIAEYVARARHERARPQWRGPVNPVEVPEFFQRKRMEDALRASHEVLEQRVAERTQEIARANAALTAEMAERQRSAEERRLLEAQLRETQKLESLGVLAGGIAHDFNNLLVGVLGNAGLALEELPEDSLAREYVRDIEAGAWRAADLVRQMLAYAGKGRLVVERIEVSGLVREMLHLLTSSISKKAVLDFAPADPGPEVEGDATQLRQVVMNLITNASDALGDVPGVIRVQTGIVRHVPDDGGAYLGAALGMGECAYVSVSDTGHGMDAATRERMFEPFFTTKFAGRGLGLAAVLGIVRSHGGAIQVTSEPDAGTLIRVLLPLAALPTVTENACMPLTGHAAQSTGTVLVADDEPLVRDVARRVLEGMGLTVVLAVDGEEAVTLFKQQRGAIVLALLDLTMPKMSGVEAFEAMRAVAPGLRAVLMSGFASEDSDSASWRSGFVGFLRKPYRPQELVDRVQEALARTAPATVL